MPDGNLFSFLFFFVLILIVFQTFSELSEIYFLDVIGMELDVNCLIEVHK